MTMTEQNIHALTVPDDEPDLFDGQNSRGGELAERPAPAPKKSALVAMASRLNVEAEKLLPTLQNTVFAGATKDEMMALVIVANEYGLNPFLKHLYAFPKKGGGIEPMVSIDGWLHIINSNPAFDGMNVDVKFGDDGKPLSATCEIHTKNRAHPTTITEYFQECFRNTEPWRQMPSRMLRHKAVIQCARIAFGIAGIHDEDECRDIERREIAEVRGGSAEESETTVETLATLDQIEEIEGLFESLEVDEKNRSKSCSWAAGSAKVKTPGVLTVEQADKLIEFLNRKAAKKGGNDDQ